MVNWMKFGVMGHSIVKEVYFLIMFSMQLDQVTKL